MSRPAQLTAPLLLALPESADPALSRAVVLLIQHDERRSFGLAINRPSQLLAKAVLESLQMTWRGDPATVIYWGGPVAPQSGWVLHAPTERSHIGQGTISITPNIWMSSSPDRLRMVGNEPPEQVRILLGSIEWPPGKLAAASNGAIYTAANPALVFETPVDQLWGHVHSIGTELEHGGNPLLRWLRGRSRSGVPRAIVKPTGGRPRR